MPIPAQPITSRGRGDHPDGHLVAPSHEALLALPPGLDVTPPSAGSPYATIYNPRTDRYCRVRAREYEVLSLFDGTRTLLQLETELADRFAASWVLGFVRKAEEHGLVATAGERDEADGSDERCRRDGGRGAHGRRVEVVRPTFIRLVWERPDRLFAAIEPAWRLLTSAWGLVVLSLTALWGLVAFVVHAPAQAEALSGSRAVSSLVLLGSVPGLMAAHELAHGLALRHFGGRVRGVGLMLLYFAPAAFCDVTDAWRLPSRGQRAAVALAGPACNLVLAGIVAIPLTVVAPGTLRDVLALVLSVNIGMALLNLVPLVRFDGYWVLVAVTDVPNLMDRSRAAGRQLLHGRRPAAGVALGLYGLTTYVAPALVLAAAVVGYQDLLLGLGPAGALGWLALVGLAVVAASRLVWRHGTPLRLAAVTAVIALAAANHAMADVAIVDWSIGEALRAL